MVKQIVKVLLSLLVAIALFLPVQSEASSCQGLSAGRCKSNSNCVWVSSHMRKGKRVKAYCRAKPTRSAVKKTKSSKKKKVTKKKRKVSKKKKVSEKKKVTKKRKVVKKKRKISSKKRKKKTSR